MKRTLITITALLAMQQAARSQALLKTGSLPTQIVEGAGAGTGSNLPISFGDGTTSIGRLTVWHSPFFANTPRFTMSSNATTFQSVNNSISLFNRDQTNNNWIRMNFCTQNTNGSDFDMVGVATQIKDHTAGNETADFVVGTTHQGVEDERMTVTSDGRLGVNSKAPTSIFEVVDQTIYNPKNYAGAITADALYRFSPGYKNYTPNLTIVNNHIGAGMSSRRSVSLLAGTWATGIAMDDQGPFIIGAQPRAEFLSDDIGLLQPMVSVWPLTGNVRVGSGNTPSPARLEVNSDTTCRSGLRLSRLTSNCAPVNNPGTGVLSVDNLGNVILVNGGSNPGGNLTGADNGLSVDPSNPAMVQFGQSCGSGSIAARLLDDREVPMNNNNILFKDVTGMPYSAFKNRIGIGVNNSCNPGAKLEVIRSIENGVPPYDVNNRAIAGINKDLADVNAGGESIGVYGEANHELSDVNVGGDFMAKYGRRQAIGVRGYAERGAVTAGGWFEAVQGAVNYGVYATTSGSFTGGAGPDYAAYFNGDAYTSGGWWGPSDRRIKKNIEPIGNALSILEKISPKQYEYRTDVHPGLHLPANTKVYGVIAQELEEVLPTLIKETNVPAADGRSMSGQTIKTVNYNQLIPILIQAVKEQQAEISALKAENEAFKATIEKKLNMLEASIAQLCEAGCPGLQQKESGAAQQPADRLYQSVPNPTGSKAIISYSLAQDGGNASVMIATADGRTVKTITLAPQSGNGSVTVDMSEYQPQTYIYSLYVNGRLADSKKMTVVR